MSAYKVKKIIGPIDSIVSVPGSKSITNRALLLGTLAEGETILKDPMFSKDTEAFLDSIKKLGFDIKVEAGSGDPVSFISIKGKGGEIPNKEAEIFVESAGTAARFLTAFLAVSDGNYMVNASEQMKKRPMKPLFDTLTELGVSLDYLESSGHLPVRIKGLGNNIKRSRVTIGSDQSTQFLSALLMVSPILANMVSERSGEDGFTLDVDGDRANGSYVKMTLAMMKRFGAEAEKHGDKFYMPKGRNFRPVSYEIEPDISAACYFYAAAALTGGHIIVRGVHKNSIQGDIKFLDVLEKMGCKIEDKKEGISLCGPEKGKLSGIDIDMKDFSDQTMTLAAIAPFCNSKVTIRNVGHIRLQESDRIHGIAVELAKMGVEVTEGADSLEIMTGLVRPSRVDTYDDHRMAMAFSITGLAADGIVIDNYECCSKTFKNFFDVLESIY